MSAEIPESETESFRNEFQCEDGCEDMAATVLTSLGLYGLSSIEEPILAALVTGDPMLLIGTHGTAKTTLVEKLAQSLGETFIAYDASKALFEDVIGFPDPKSIASGTIQYIPTELSVWNKSFVLVDEISRATPSMQNKWLEIIRSRRVMGLKIPNLRYVFAAMNPPTYDGAYPLDPALAGRFAFIIPMPEVCDMAPQEVRAITCSRNNGDAPALPPSGAVYGHEVTGAFLMKLLKLAREQFPIVEASFGQGISQFLCRFNYALAGKKRELALDGRRLGLMYRGILSVLALRAAREDGFMDVEAPEDVSFLSSMITWMLPYPAMAGPSPSPHAIESAVTWAIQEKEDPERVTPVMSCAQAMKQFLTGKELAPSVIPEWVRMTLEDLGHPDLDRRVDAAVSLTCLAPLAAGRMDTAIPPSWRARLLRAWRLWTQVTPGMLEDSDLIQAIRQGPLASSSEGSLDAHLALLLALHVSQDNESKVTEHNSVFPDEAYAAYTAICSRFDQMKELLGLHNVPPDAPDLFSQEPGEPQTVTQSRTRPKRRIRKPF